MNKSIALLGYILVIAALTGYSVYKLLNHETENYVDKLRNIAEHVNSASSTWKAGNNSRWENMDIAGIKRSMGVLKGKPKGVNLETVFTQQDNLPTNFDSRDQWGAKCTSLLEVRDQSNCGSCWAFAAAESLSDRHCIKLGNDIRLSAQNLVTCCTSCGYGCEGGYPEAAMSYYVKTGLVTGDLYGDKSWCQAYSFPPCAHHTASEKYPACTGELPTPPCVTSCDKDSTYSKTYSDDLHKGSKAYAVSSNQEAIMTEIYNNGPVEVAFAVFEDFLTYKSGVYKHLTGQELGGHAVKMIGWGVENGTPYWLIVNSWNETWGDKGTFKILRGSNECGIESNVVTALPAS